MKIARNASSGRFTTLTEAKRKPRTHVVETVTIRENATGRELQLKGYGAMKGKFAVKKGVDLTKPIATQTLSKRTTSKGAVKKK